MLREFIKRNQFTLAGRLTFVDGTLKYTSEDGEVKKVTDPCSYIWVGRNDVERCMYVGRAGFGITRRMAQHVAGFAHSPAGATRRLLIHSYFYEGGEPIDVFFRRSETKEVFGVEVSLNAAEEHALYHMLQPAWNFASFPRALMPERDERLSIGELRVEGLQGGETEELWDYWRFLEDSQRHMFSQLIRFLMLLGYGVLDVKIVRGYSEQPPGCSNVPSLVFGEILAASSRRFSRNSWCARLPLVAVPTVVFPREILADGESHENVVFSADKRSWRPVEIEVFLRDDRSAGSWKALIDTRALIERLTS